MVSSDAHASLDLDRWLADPAIRITHRRDSSATPESLWEAARGVRLTDTMLLGKLVRWRIPGVPAGISYDELFRSPPFVVLVEGEQLLISGLVGRIWTLRRDYPSLTDPSSFRAWSEAGTARVLFANWAAPPGASDARAALWSETRLEAFGAQGRIGLATVRPLIRGFQQLVASDAIAAAVRRAEEG
ncbi:MAG: hypothetical protein JOY58_20575 [Solirubrobacterales bacterium]|nr:hypothetical protein [Solirubrobacterales bacterium]